MTDRRTFIKQSGAGLLAACIGASMPKQPKHILVRSSWATVNIGDIAHTPGILHILSTHLPQAKLYLWPSKIDNGVDQILRSRFPGLIIVDTDAKRREAFQTCDFLLHGSGASLVAERDVRKWSVETEKPYGIYGITFPPKKSWKTTPEPAAAISSAVQVLSKAAFVFFRDSKSLAFAKTKGCSSPIMKFGPDAAFACDLRDDARAKAFIEQHDLETKKFFCCIPRLRYTPSWLIPDKKRKIDLVKHARNEQMQEHDHAPWREAIMRIIKETSYKVLLCPEDQTQMQVGKDLLYDRLPSKIQKSRVVWRPNYWLTGEAVSIYRHSLGLFGNEMHSPIMCIGQGIPALVGRWKEQTTKGFMWADIGLEDWLFDLDNPEDIDRIVPTVIDMALNNDAFQVKAVGAQKLVLAKQAMTMEILANELVG
ncbi:MAG: polysaccharide pyruvyl transferase family protein [Saprospiraceae bacterium]|nr:polysaccharide pyruvyl transferase family protein [Saprospiraceae bacterium]